MHYRDDVAHCDAAAAPWNGRIHHVQTGRLSTSDRLPGRRGADRDPHLRYRHSHESEGDTQKCCGPENSPLGDSGATQCPLAGWDRILHSEEMAWVEVANFGDDDVDDADYDVTVHTDNEIGDENTVEADGIVVR